MTQVRQITKEDLLMLLGRTSPSGVLSVYIGLPAADRHDPQRWLSAVRSGLKDLGQRQSGEKALPLLLETALAEIEALPLEARHRSLVYFRSRHPDWVFWRSLQTDLPDFFAFDPAPQVRHLVTAVDETPILGVAVISQERTRVLTWRAGLLEEVAEIGTEEAEARADVPENRAADRTRRRLAGLAQRLVEIGGAQGWARLLLIGPNSSTETVTGSLPDSWHRLLIDPLDRNLIHAPLAELAAVTGQRFRQWKGRVDLEEVEHLLGDARSGKRACVGLDVCLERLHERRVERLYVSGDLHLEGYRDQSGRLYARPPLHLGRETYSVEPRLAERMVVSAIEAGAAVVPLEGEPAKKLGLSGGVAARLRWGNNGGIH